MTPEPDTLTEGATPTERALTAAERHRLDVLAREAMSVGWYDAGTFRAILDGDDDRLFEDADAAFLAAVTPQVVRRLLADAERARAPEGNGPGVLADAMYEDGCLTPPRTDHADHVVAALAQNGYEVASLRAARAEPGLREAAQRVVSQAETDDDFEGQFVDYLVPAPSLDALRAALEAHGEPSALDVERGTCWFCKGRFVIDALIAGYDTWEEQRLACLACNERMIGNWRPLRALRATPPHLGAAPEARR